MGSTAPEGIELAARYPLALSEMRWPSAAIGSYEAQPLARWGIECPTGWRPILERLLVRLETAIAAEPTDRRDDFRIVQVKEKFERLTVHLAAGGTPDMKLAIRDAAATSVVTCEVCSAPEGLAQRGAWWVAKVRGARVLDTVGWA